MSKSRRHVLRLAAGAAALPLALRPADAQTFPTRPIRVIVPVAPGGANDTTARIVTQKLAERLGQQLYIENQPGAGGNIGVGLAARAQPDGYTILAAASSFVINPSLYEKVPYDPVKDFAPVTMLCSTSHVLVVYPQLPARTVLELIDLVRANPGKYSFASAGTGTPAHLAGELFRITFGLDMVHVPFGGGGPAITSTLGGHTQICFAALSTAAPNVASGGVRGLAITSAKRSALLADVPTMAEAGAPGQEANVITAFLVPAGTAREIVDRLNRETVAAVAAPDVRQRLAALGFEPETDTPEEFAAWIRTEVAKWARVIRAANIRIE